MGLGLRSGKQIDEEAGFDTALVPALVRYEPHRYRQNKYIADIIKHIKIPKRCITSYIYPLRFCLCLSSVHVLAVRGRFVFFMHFSLDFKALSYLLKYSKIMFELVVVGV